MDVPVRDFFEPSSSLGELGLVYRMDTGVHWLWDVGWHERRYIILRWNFTSVVCPIVRLSSAIINQHRGIIGPILVAKGLAFGTAASQDSKWTALMNYASLSSEFTTVDHPSPRYWLLWPGVLCMIFVSFTGR